MHCSDKKQATGILYRKLRTVPRFTLQKSVFFSFAGNNFLMVLDFPLQNNGIFKHFGDGSWKKCVDNILRQVWPTVNTISSLYWLNLLRFYCMKKTVERTRKNRQEHFWQLTIQMIHYLHHVFVSIFKHHVFVLKGLLLVCRCKITTKKRKKKKKISRNFADDPLLGMVWSTMNSIRG